MISFSINGDTQVLRKIMPTLKVRIISDYQDKTVSSWLKQQSKNGDSCYENNDFKISYTTENIPTDYTILINKVDTDTQIICDLRNILGIQQEPFISGSQKYLIPFKNEFAKNAKTYHQCSKVFAFVPQLLHQNSKFVASPPFVYWLIDGERHLSFEQIKNLDLSKTKDISCIANTDKRAFAGHIQRANFVHSLKTLPPPHFIPIDYYGGEKAHNMIKSKLQALQPYRYSIAIENSATPFYFTEKITDCYLAGCMPIYYGASNITDFFPQESLIWIDIHNPKEAQKIISSALKEQKWEKNQDFILEARRRVMEEYNFLQAMGENIINHYKTIQQPLHQEKIVIKGYKRSFWIHILRNLQRISFVFLQPLSILRRKNDENNTFNQR